MTFRLHPVLGSKKPKEDHDKRNFLADAMREMESGEKALIPVSAVRKAPNVIRIVMRPEVSPRRHHRRHRHKHLNSLASILKLAVGLDKFNKSSHKNKTAERINAEKTLLGTVHFLEKVNDQLENKSKSHKNGEHKMTPKLSNDATAKVRDEAVMNESFPFFPELRSIVEHGKPFNPDVTRAAFARAKEIVWDSVGQDPATTDIGHLNNTKLTNAVALLEMAVREAEKMHRNKTNTADQGKPSSNQEISETSQPKLPSQRTKQDAHQLKILKDLLLEELKQTNYTKGKAGILISDIPFQKLRSHEQTNVGQRLLTAADNSSLDSKTSSSSKKPAEETQALLRNYTSFITNILKAAHLSVLKNLTGDATNSAIKNNTNLNPNTQIQAKQTDSQTQHHSFEQLTTGQQTNEPQKQKGQQQLSFSNAAQEQKQQQQRQQQGRRFQQPFLSKERLAARKAFGTAQKLVKAFLARQELYKAENEFFTKIHEMLNQTASNHSPTDNQVSDVGDSKLTNQPTVASPIQSPLSQSPINTEDASSVGGGGDKKQTSEAQKKFEEAAHLEEKVAAQQDEMYDALMGHAIGSVKGDGGFNEDGAIHETPEQDAVDDSYNTEDYGDFKDSDEEVERKFYHDHRRGDFESKAEDDSSFSLRNRISNVKSVGLGSTDVSGSGLPSADKNRMSKTSTLYSSFESSGDSDARNNVNVSSNVYKHSSIVSARKTHDSKTYRKASKSQRKNIYGKRRSEVNRNSKAAYAIEQDIKTPNLEIQVL